MQFGGGGVAMGDDGFLPHGDAFHGFQGTLGAASGAYLRPSAALPSASGPGTFDEYANEPPLLEELGVNFSAIGTKTTAVLMLHRPISPEVLLDADLAGPLVFCVVLGLCLLLVRCGGAGSTGGGGVPGPASLQGAPPFVSPLPAP
jgi:hypothetical protein